MTASLSAPAVVPQIDCDALDAAIAQLVVDGTLVFEKDLSAIAPVLRPDSLKAADAPANAACVFGRLPASSDGDTFFLVEWSWAPALRPAIQTELINVIGDFLERDHGLPLEAITTMVRDALHHAANDTSLALTMETIRWAAAEAPQAKTATLGHVMVYNAAQENLRRISEYDDQGMRAARESVRAARAVLWHHPMRIPPAEMIASVLGNAVRTELANTAAALHAMTERRRARARIDDAPGLVHVAPPVGRAAPAVAPVTGFDLQRAAGAPTAPATAATTPAPRP